MLHRSLPVIALVAAFAACGCSGSNDSDTPFIPATDTPTPTATPSESQSPTPSPTPTPTASSTPERPVSKPAGDGDVDGDGRVDRIAVSAGSAGERWKVNVRMTALGTRAGQVHADAEPRVEGVVDADADGFAEIFLQTGSGASTQLLTPMRLVDGVLREVTRGGAPAQLAVGGTVTHGSGFSCRNTDHSDRRRELIVYDGQTIDGVTWEGEVTTYRWVAGTLNRIGARHESFTYAGIDDNKVARYYQVDCGSLGG